MTRASLLELGLISTTGLEGPAPRKEKWLIIKHSPALVFDYFVLFAPTLPIVKKNVPAETYAC